MSTNHPRKKITMSFSTQDENGRPSKVGYLASPADGTGAHFLKVEVPVLNTVSVTEAATQGATNAEATARVVALPALGATEAAAIAVAKEVCEAPTQDHTESSSIKMPASSPEPLRDHSPRDEGLGGCDRSVFLVVVTGGSKGIGRACVSSFAQRGARVLFTYCADRGAAKQVEMSFQPAGRVQGRRLDQGDFESVQAFAAEVDKWRGGQDIDTVVNNAALGVATVSAYAGLRPSEAEIDSFGVRGAGGEGEAKRITDYDKARRWAEEDVALMRVNALGPLWVTEALLPMMRPRCSAYSGYKDDRPRVTAATATVGKTTKGATACPLAAAGSGKKKKKTVLFVGSVGGGSQAVFPGFRAADAMSKAAVAYASKHFAARSRQQLNDQALQIPQKNTTVATAEKPSSDQNPNTDGVTNSANWAAVEERQAAAVPATFESNASNIVDFLCLCPGATETDMFRASTLDKMKVPGELERFLNALPQGRLMQPEEVGEAVYWLCSSPAASMFHGAVIDASAGLAVRPGALTEFSF